MSLGELSRVTEPLSCGPECRQWKMPSVMESADPVVRPTKLHNCGQAFSCIHEMMIDDGPGPARGQWKEREVNRFNLHVGGRVIGTCWGLDLRSKRKGGIEDVLYS